MKHPAGEVREGGRDRDARAGRREGGQGRHRSGDCPSELGAALKHF